jgi:hypothetical protein
MDSNRSEILSQLASGQISADQAAQQLRGPAAPPQPEPPAAPPPTPEPSAAPARRWLRVRVSDIESGRQRVSVNLPLSWLSLGLRIGARFSPEVAALDPNDLLAALQSGASGQVVDVEDLDDGERVQIFIE